jgi:GntP family gluconate:H+ symporter
MLGTSAAAMVIDPFLILLVGLTIVVGGIIAFRLHAFLALLLAAFVVGLLTSSDALLEFSQQDGMSEKQAIAFAAKPLGKRLASAFGNTAAKVGILIALASIIGTCLLKSGGADRIIRSALKLFGEKRAPLAFLTSGFTLAIPVFFDTVFYLLIPLGKSMGIRSPRNYGLYLMAIIAGTAMAHSLVPPTPGPLFVAEELGVDLGLMILGGLAVGIVSVTGGYGYALWANRKWQVPLRDTPDCQLEELQAMVQTPEAELPSLRFSLLPIALPLILIAGNTILQATCTELAAETNGVLLNRILSISALVGDSQVALAIATLSALALMKSQIEDGSQYRKYIQESLHSGGMIILITSAGGALGGMLQQTGIGIRIEELARHYQLSLLPLAFLVTALVRTAQGSATVAMITAVGVLGGVADSGSLEFHPVYLALAIGCGSKPIPWMNDSGFWVITKMSGMIETEAIRHYSVLLTLMGVTGLLTTMLFASLLPMI